MKDLKTINLLAEKLNSKNIEEVLFTINQIRNSCNSLILPHVFELLNITKSKEIHHAIVGLLNDLKIQEGTSEIIKAIKDQKYKSIHKILLTSCWQSGLQYAAHLSFFVKLFISAPFENALEAFTIIENIEGQYNSSDIDPLIRELKNAVGKAGKEKEGLLVELVHILEDLKQNADAKD